MTKNLRRMLLTAFTTTALFGGLTIAPAAQATVYTLSLNGMVANASYSTFPSSGSIYQTGVLDLGAVGPITIDNGDELQVTIALDGLFTVPGTVNGSQFFGINFQDEPTNAGPTILPPPAPEVSTGTISFSGGTGAAISPVGTNCGNCVSNLYGAGGPVAAFTFTGLFGDNTIQSLAAPFTFNDVTISYQVNTAVPEPAAWALMLIGVGAMGAVLRRSRGAVRASI